MPTSPTFRVCTPITSREWSWRAPPDPPSAASANTGRESKPMADQVQTVNDAPKNNTAQEQPRPPEPGARPEPRSPESRRRLGFLAIGILVVLAVVGFFLWRYLQ